MKMAKWDERVNANFGFEGEYGYKPEAVEALRFESGKERRTPRNGWTALEFPFLSVMLDNSEPLAHGMTEFELFRLWYEAELEYGARPFLMPMLGRKGRTAAYKFILDSLRYDEFKSPVEATFGLVEAGDWEAMPDPIRAWVLEMLAAEAEARRRGDADTLESAKGHADARAAEALSAAKDYVRGREGSAAPLADGGAAAGGSEKFAREDHVHPRLAATETQSGSVRVQEGNGLALEDGDRLAMSLATQARAGAMSDADKRKLDGMEGSSAGGGFWLEIRGGNLYKIIRATERRNAIDVWNEIAGLGEVRTALTIAEERTGLGSWDMAFELRSGMREFAMLQNRDSAGSVVANEWDALMALQSGRASVAGFPGTAWPPMGAGTQTHAPGAEAAVALVRRCAHDLMTASPVARAARHFTETRRQWATSRLAIVYARYPNAPDFWFQFLVRFSAPLAPIGEAFTLDDIDAQVHIAVTDFSAADQSTVRAALGDRGPPSVMFVGNAAPRVEVPQPSGTIDWPIEAEELVGPVGATVADFPGEHSGHYFMSNGDFIDYNAASPHAAGFQNGQLARVAFPTAEPHPNRVISQFLIFQVTDSAAGRGRVVAPYAANTVTWHTTSNQNFTSTGMADGSRQITAFSGISMQTHAPGDIIVASRNRFVLLEVMGSSQRVAVADSTGDFGLMNLNGMASQGSWEQARHLAAGWMQDIHRNLHSSQRLLVTETRDPRFPKGSVVALQNMSDPPNARASVVGNVQAGGQIFVINTDGDNINIQDLMAAGMRGRGGYPMEASYLLNPTPVQRIARWYGTSRLTIPPFSLLEITDVFQSGPSDVNISARVVPLTGMNPTSPISYEVGETILAYQDWTDSPRTQDYRQGTQLPGSRIHVADVGRAHYLARPTSDSNRASGIIQQIGNAALPAGSHQLLHGIRSNRIPGTWVVTHYGAVPGMSLAWVYASEGVRCRCPWTSGRHNSHFWMSLRRIF